MKRVMIACIRWYQRRISAHTKPACRFTPTCSAYAIEALSRFGAVRGSILATWRILRCNPFGTPGYDPVPERFTLKKQIQPVSIDDEEADSLYDGD